MMTYIQARDALLKHLVHDANAHDAERFDEIGRRFDSLENLFPRGRDPGLMKLHVAMTFWDGWQGRFPHGNGFMRRRPTNCERLCKP